MLTSGLFRGENKIVFFFFLLAFREGMHEHEKRTGYSQRA